jgi:uncharacterized protein with GYD domain
MIKFALFFSYTPETWARMISAPSDRAAAVRATIEQAGGTLESLYYMLGDQDGIVIFDVPDADAAAAVALLVTSSGAFRSVSTHQLIPSADLPAVLTKAAAGQGSYVRPGD